MFYTFLANENGFPLSIDSKVANSSMFYSINSANLYINLPL